MQYVRYWLSINKNVGDVGYRPTYGQGRPRRTVSPDQRWWVWEGDAQAEWHNYPPHQGTLLSHSSCMACLTPPPPRQ
ncbi:hypothetical protein O3P69_007508 [Scylla paramamosain]|uniref:Uncharacterized protein n=1 Tax=Scylla paramamosain TaxID=85552 RepID=A0AAW0V6L8_SCYPA